MYYSSSTRVPLRYLLIGIVPINSYRYTGQPRRSPHKSRDRSPRGKKIRILNKKKLLSRTHARSARNFVAGVLLLATDALRVRLRWRARASHLCHRSAYMYVHVLLLFQLVGPARAGRPVPTILADQHQPRNLRRLSAAAAPAGRTVALAVAPPPGVTGLPVAVEMAADAVAPSAGPLLGGGGLLGANLVGTSSVPVAAFDHWAAAADLPRDYDARQAYPMCSTMRAVQNQGACAGCYSFASTAALGDRICQATNGTADAILSAEDPLFCPNLGAIIGRSTHQGSKPAVRCSN